MESKAGSILSLIGGILQLVGAVLFFIVSVLDKFYIFPPIGFYIFLVIVYLIIGILSISAYKWMKNPETTKKGGITALVCGIIGFNIITLIGGILGLVDSGK